MFSRLHNQKGGQLVLGFLMGICFGFLLQRGGVTRYDVILGQLLLKDWTVAKIILTAVITGMLGVYVMRYVGWVKLHKKSGSIGSTVVGGLLFGAGFGLLGYCPGTALGAVGQGSLDALFGGVVGILLGAGIYAGIYPRVRDRVLPYGAFGDTTLPELLRIKPGFAVLGACVVLGLALLLIESNGF
ncbi:MAG: YeeE/YedE thiosulfate transporter family protein [Candidatus Hydrogenedentota bacterium]